MGHSHLSADQTKLFLLRFSTKRCIFQSLGTLCNFALLSNYGKKPVNSSLQLRIGGSIGCLNSSTPTNAFRLIFCLHSVSIWNVCFPSSQLKTNIKTIFHGISPNSFKKPPPCVKIGDEGGGGFLLFSENLPENPHFLDRFPLVKSHFGDPKMPKFSRLRRATQGKMMLLRRRRRKICYFTL